MSQLFPCKVRSDAIINEDIYFVPRKRPSTLPAETPHLDALGKKSLQYHFMTSADASTNPFTDCSAHFTSHASSHHSTDAPAHAFGFTAQRKLEESEESFVGEEDLSDPSRFARAAPNCNCDNEEDSQEISKSSPSFTKPTYDLNREGIDKVREIEQVSFFQIA